VVVGAGDERAVQLAGAVVERRVRYRIGGAAEAGVEAAAAAGGLGLAVDDADAVKFINAGLDAARTAGPLSDSQKS